MRGFSYGELSAEPEVDWEARVGWLERGDYSPQPYEQLAAFYRQTGHPNEASRVAIARHRQLRARLGLPGKVWSDFLYATVGYGYRMWLAGVWLLALLAGGTALFDRADVTAARERVPEFHSVLYTLDLLLPVINLHQRDGWIPHDHAQWLAVIFTVAGWLLTTSVAAGVAGALKRS
jgi:hypothetical protein